MTASVSIAGSSREDPAERSGPLFDMQTVTVVVLLAVTFITSLRVNGMLHRLPMPALLILLVLNLQSTRLKVGTVVAYIAFVALTLIHLVVLDSTGRIPFTVSDVLKDYVKYIGLAGIYIAFFSKVTWSVLEEPCLRFFKLMALIALAFWALAVGAGGTYAVDVSYTMPRLQSLMTEPSNMAHFLPALLIYSYLQRNWLWVLISGAAIGATFSPTVYLTLLMSFVVLRILTARPFYLLVVLSLVTLAVLTVVENFESLIAVLNDAGQLGQAGARILEGFQFIASGGGQGANSRADLIFAGVDFMNEYGLWWTGTGLGTSAFIGDAFNDGLLFDSNTWSSIIMWFGLVSVPFWAGIQYLAVRRVEKSFTYVLLVSLCVSNTLNAGGIWLQMFFATMLCIKLKHDYGRSA